MTEAKAKTGKDAKARKSPRKKTAASTARKIVKPAPTGTVYAFQPRLGNNKTMETFMTSKKHQFEKFTNDASQVHQDGVEAMMKSGNIAMKGMEDIMKTCMQIAQSSAEKNAQAFKTLLGCRTLNEFSETQNRLAQENFDDLMATATRLSELTVKLATEALEPINDQFSKSIRKASDALAA